MDIGIAFEGGGARGAYQIGAVKLLLERKYNITAALGTSIGAINAAMIAQDKFKEAYDMWENLSYSTVFDIDDRKLLTTSKIKIDLDIVKYLSGKLKDAVKTGGVSTEKMKELISKYVDEDEIRKGKVLYGLVTYSLTDRKSRELFIEDIPKGKLANFIMASGNLPGFKKQEIDGKIYIDGGVENNCPINMLIAKQYKNIFAIRTGSIWKAKDIKEIRARKDLNITFIEPKNKLSHILNFDKKTLNELLKLGYFDAQKAIDKLDGYNFYFRPISEEKIFEALCNLDINIINDIYGILKIKKEKYDSKKTFFEKVLPDLIKALNTENENKYKDLLVGMLEHIAQKEKIEMFKVYDYKEIIETIKNITNKIQSKTKQEQVMYKITKNIKI